MSNIGLINDTCKARKAKPFKLLIISPLSSLR